MLRGLSKTQVLTPKTLKTEALARELQNYSAPLLVRSAQFDLFSHIHPTLGKGGLAQLVERLLCKQNVNGSNPLTSTTRSLLVFSFQCSAKKT